MAAHKLSTNPLFLRLTRRCGWPSGRAALWLAVALGVASFVISAGAVWQQGATLAIIDEQSVPGGGHHVLFTAHVLLRTAQVDRFSALMVFLLALAWPVNFLAPAIVGLLAATLTGRDVHSEAYRLLRLTDLSAGVRALGYITAALYRLRVLLAMVVGLAPVLVLGMLYARLAFVSASPYVDYDPTRLFGLNLSPYTRLCPPYPVALMCVSPQAIDPLYHIQTFLALAIGLLGLNGLAAILGMSLALRWRRPIPAALVTLLVVLGHLALVINKVMLDPLMPTWFPGGPLLSLLVHILTLWIQNPLFIMLIPYVLAVGFLWLAQRWA